MGANTMRSCWSPFPTSGWTRCGEFLKGGLPLLAEKPLSLELEEAVQIVDLARAHGTPLAVGLNFRFLPVSQKVRELVTQEVVGAPGFGQFVYQRNRDGMLPHLNKYPLTMQHPMMLEQSIHHLDLIRFCYDRRVEEIACRTWNPPWSMYAHDSNVNCLLGMAGGLEVNYLGTWTGGWNSLQFEWRTDCAGGVIVQRELFENLAWAKMEDPELQPIPLPPCQAFFDDTAALWQAFIAHVQDGGAAVVQRRRPPGHARPLFCGDREQRHGAHGRLRRLLPQAWDPRRLMRILLTGAGGFVGSNVAGVLAATLAAGTPGARLIAADLAPLRAETRRLLAPVAEHVTWVTLDVRDRAALRELVAGEGVTHIVHGAAITALPDEEAARAVEIVDVNLGSTINVLAVAAAAQQVERVIVLSSSGVYAVPPHGRLDKGARRQPEEGELALDGLYSITKRSGELLAGRFAQLTGKKMAAVRLPAVYGPLEKPSATRPGTSTVHRLMEALRRRQAITVAGPQVGRDWTYVADAGDAIARLLAAPEWHYSVYNVSCGHRYAFREVVAAFAAHGLQATWIGGEEHADVAMRPSHERLPLDTRRLRRDTGFTPRV